MLEPEAVEIVLGLERGSQEWDRIWKVLGEWQKLKYGTADVVCENPDNGERWQYMGCTEAIAGCEEHHTFRHRSYPLSCFKRHHNVYFRTPASRQTSWKRNPKTTRLTLD
jgi:hypothetical protein